MEVVFSHKDRVAVPLGSSLGIYKNIFKCHVCFLMSPSRRFFHVQGWEHLLCTPSSSPCSCAAIVARSHHFCEPFITIEKEFFTRLRRKLSLRSPNKEFIHVVSKVETK